MFFFPLLGRLEFYRSSSLQHDIEPSETLFQTPVQLFGRDHILLTKLLVCLGSLVKVFDIVFENYVVLSGRRIRTLCQVYVKIVNGGYFNHKSSCRGIPAEIAPSCFFENFILLI